MVITKITSGINWIYAVTPLVTVILLILARLVKWIFQKIYLCDSSSAISSQLTPRSAISTII